MKKLLALVVLLAFAFVLNACWPGEISVTTEFNADGSGTRYIILEVMDDTLSTEPITNPDDPEGTEGKGAVLNDKHIDGGVIAIQTWLEENAPDFITVHKATVDASLDWAIDGIYNSIYNEADLAGFVTKADISVLANYSVTINEGSVEELRTYDAAAADGDFTGKVIFVESENFEVTGEFFNTTLLIIVILGVAVVGVGGFFVFKKIKK